MRRASTEPLRPKAARPPPHRFRQQSHSDPSSRATQKPVNGEPEALPPQQVVMKRGAASTRVMGPVMAALRQSLTIAETVAAAVTAAAVTAAVAAVVAAAAAVVTMAAAVAAEIGHA